MTYREMVTVKGEPETKEDAYRIGQCSIIALLIELLGHNSLTFTDIQKELPRIMAMKNY